MKLCLKEKGFTLRDRFTILNEAGDEVYQVVGKLLSFGHKLTVSDMAGNEVLYIHQKVLTLLAKYFIEPAGQPELELKAHFSPIHHRYTLETPEGEWEISGDFLQHEIEMKRGGETVATVTKKWFSWGDTYMMDVPDERNLMAAMGAMLAIDCINDDTAAAVAASASASGAAAAHKSAAENSDSKE